LQTAELDTREHVCNIKAQRRSYELQCHDTKLLSVVTSTPRQQLHNGLHIDVHTLRLLSHLGFTHEIPEVFQQKMHVSILLQRQTPKAHTLTRTDRPQGTKSGGKHQQSRV
jgi:hypothetical protein